MKNAEINQKPMSEQHSAGGEAYAAAARDAWEKPSTGASAKTDSTARPESGSGQTITNSDSGPEKIGNGVAGQPEGGGGHRIEPKGEAPTQPSAGEGAGARQEGSEPEGSTLNGSAGAADKNNALKSDGAGNFGKPEKLDTAPEQGKAGAESMHSAPSEHVDKQDAALKFLPSLSIA